MKFCTYVVGITLTVTTLKIIFYVLPFSAGVHIGIFWDPFWCVIFYILETAQCLFMKFCADFYKIFMAPFYVLGSTRAQQLAYVVKVRTSTFIRNTHDFGDVYFDNIFAL